MTNYNSSVKKGNYIIRYETSSYSNFNEVKDIIDDQVSKDDIYESNEVRLIQLRDHLALNVSIGAYPSMTDSEIEEILIPILDKRIPKFPSNMCERIVCEEHDPISGDCPVCGRKNLDENNKICPDCGQYLKWR